MMKHLYIIILSLIFAFPQQAEAQIITSSDPTIARGVIVNKDPRVDLLLDKHKNVQLGVIRSGRGYRVQIYYGNDRAKATNLKIDFMSRYPGVRATLSYIHPQYRVKVGDFATSKEAWDFYRQIDDYYSPCMVVPDMVIINTLNDD